MKTTKEYLQVLKATSKNLIPNYYNNAETFPWLAPYFGTTERPLAGKYDMKYMGFELSNLQLVDEDPDVLESLVMLACENFEYKWKKLYEVTQLEYNPIWNVDGTETVTTDLGVRHSEQKNGQSKSTSENSEKPFDDNTYKSTAKNEVTRDEYTDEFDADAVHDVVTTQRGGNIGVTKTQDMIKDEREVADFVYLDVVMKDVINAITYPSFARG